MLWFGQNINISQASATTAVITSNNNSAIQKPDTIKGVPRHITIASLGIDTEIVDGAYDLNTGKWTLTEDTAFYATVSDPANSKGGNTFVYGHNSQKIFGKLLGIRNGAKAVVTTDNGYEFTYEFIRTEAVNPTDVAVLNYSGKPRLTLQTCSGLWNQTRQMSYYELVGYKKL